MSDMRSDILESEWPYPILSDDIANTPQRLTLKADADQCASLARRLGVEAVKSASAEMVVKRNSGNMVVYVEGTVRAALTQNCVVTLEPIPTEVIEAFEAWYADPDHAVSFAKARQAMLSQKMGEETPMLSEEEDPEPIVDGVIDLGELATQYLVLGVNPFPHAEGVHYELGDDNLPEEMSDIRKNPFAKLKEWKDKA